MLGKTHRAGGVMFTMVGFEVMRHNGMLLPDVNPFLQLAVMYPVAQWGSTLPDLDHHWDSVGAKTPVNWVAHKLLHLSKPKHRSWQTHSLLVTGGFMFLVFAIMSVGNQIWTSYSDMDWILFRLLATGFLLGLASHLVLDLINPSGIHTIPGHKVRLVPRTEFFATGGPWETIVYRICLLVSFLVTLNIVLSFFGKSLLSLFS